MIYGIIQFKAVVIPKIIVFGAEHTSQFVFPEILILYKSEQEKT